MPTRNLLLSSVLLFGVLCVVTASCRIDDFAGGRSEAVLTIENRSVRPFAPIIFDLELLPLIDPRPWLTAEEFEQLKVVPDSSVELDEVVGVQPGDDIGLFLYARCECDPSSSGQECPKNAPYAQFLSVEADELTKRNYKIVVSDVPAPECLSGD